MKTLLLILLVMTMLLFSGAVHAAKKETTLLLVETFDANIKTGLAKALLKNRYISFAKGKGKNGSNAIRVSYVGYQHGSQRVVVNYPLGAQVKQATLSFDVRFDKDFQWVRGGKLHGLGPQKFISGGNNREPESWSGRIMFRPKGACQTYLYDQSQKEKYGIGNKSKNRVFIKDKWHHVLLQISLNDVNKPNGFARILIDNKKITQTKEVKFRSKSGNNTLIQTFLFNTFHGGHSPQWAPVDKNGKPITVYAYFDNFVVKEGIQQR